MRMRLGMIVLLSLVPGLRAQAVPDDAVYAPLQHNGTLVIWWIERTNAAQRAQFALEKIVPSVPRIPLDQRSASELGQNASATGQNAGSYGQTASSYGTNASNTGQTASSYGTAASNVGHNASDTGQSASSYGQAASTLGQNASTFGVAASDTDKQRRETGPMQLTGRQQGMASVVRSSFPGLNLRMVAVADVQLKDRLAAAQSAGTYPDVVMADGALPDEWRTLAAPAGVVTLGEVQVKLVQEFNDQRVGTASRPVAAILVRAPHPEAARAYVTWLREGEIALTSPRLNDASAAVAEVAAGAATAVLNGGSVAGADPAIAEFAPGLAREAAIASTEPQAETAAAVRMDVLSVVLRSRLAVVRLRATLGSPTAFGLTYPLVVLRRVGDGGWKVLQISVGLEGSQAGFAETMLARYTDGQASGPLTAVSGLRPLDGDMRAPQPELGWEHGETGRLFVVEWQQGMGGTSSWSASNLFFVPNEGMRSQTRVNAQFAQAGGLYRWRVWTAGSGGALQLGAWQTFMVVGR